MAAQLVLVLDPPFQKWRDLVVCYITLLRHVLPSCLLACSSNFLINLTSGPKTKNILLHLVAWWILECLWIYSSFQDGWIGSFCQTRKLHVCIKKRKSSAPLGIGWGEVKAPCLHHSIPHPIQPAHILMIAFALYGHWAQVVFGGSLIEAPMI